MKLRVFYDEAGVIVSVVQVSLKARTQPTSAHYSYIDVDQKETDAQSLAEIHTRFRVNGDGRLQQIPRRGPTTD